MEKLRYNAKVAEPPAGIGGTRSHIPGNESCSAESRVLRANAKTAGCRFIEVGSMSGCRQFVSART
jgi:hypothetical protein